MAQTLLQVRTRVRGHIDEPSANYWSDSELNGLIDDRQWDLWRKVLALRKDYWLSTFTLTTTAGTYSYSAGSGGVPTDIWRIESIRTTLSGYQGVGWVPGRPNDAAFLGGLNSDDPVSLPDCFLYALRNLSTLWISPTPQIALTALVAYIQQPTVMALDADTFLLPDAFLSYVEYMAAGDALSKGPVGDAVGWQQKAADAWGSIRELLDTPRSDQGPDVVLGFGESEGSGAGEY